MYLGDRSRVVRQRIKAVAVLGPILVGVVNGRVRLVAGIWFVEGESRLACPSISK